MSNDPAYTARPEYQCDGSMTHYQGCKCHEARRDARIEELEAQRDALLAMSNEERAENSRLRSCLESATHHLNESCDQFMSARNSLRAALQASKDSGSPGGGVSETDARSSAPDEAAGEDTNDRR